MPGNYSFEIDPARRLLRIVFSGFFGVEDLCGYVAAKSDALRRLSCPPNMHLTLCDFSTCTPQSQAVVDLFRAALDDPRSRSRRLAIVIGSALSRLQAKRAVTRSDAAFFSSIVAAEDWLFESAMADQASIASGRPAKPSSSSTTTSSRES